MKEFVIRTANERIIIGKDFNHDCRDLCEREYNRAAAQHPDNPAYHMRPMFYSGSPFAVEIRALVTA